MKRTSIRQTTRNFTIVLAGMMLCASSLAAQTATRQRFTQADVSSQEPQQKPKPTSNVDPLGILNAPEPPKPNAPTGQTPQGNKPTPMNGQPTSRATVMSSSLDAMFSPNAIPVVIYHPVSRNFLRGGGSNWGTTYLQKSALFKLIDLNGGQLESGDVVMIVQQQTGQVLLASPGEKDRGLMLGPQSNDESAKFKIVKLQTPKDQGFAVKGIINNEDPIALQTSDGQTLKVAGMVKRPKIEVTSKFEKETIFQIHIAESEAQGLAAAQASEDDANRRAAEQQQRQQEKGPSFAERFEQWKVDARNEQIRQAEEAQRINAEQEAAREEAAKRAEAQRQIDEFRRAEAEAKRQQEAQAEQAAAERRMAEQRESEQREAERQAAEAQRQQELSTPRLLFPVPNGVMENGCSNYSANKTESFTWAGVASATAYLIAVRHVNAATPVIAEVVTVPAFSRTSNSYVADHNRTGWTWQVRARINGEWGNWSEVRAFQYGPLDANPSCRK